jgi:hypothetical protein
MSGFLKAYYKKEKGEYLLNYSAIDYGFLVKDS